MPRRFCSDSFYLIKLLKKYALHTTKIMTAKIKHVQHKMCFLVISTKKFAEKLCRKLVLLIVNPDRCTFGAFNLHSFNSMKMDNGFVKI